MLLLLLLLLLLLPLRNKEITARSNRRLFNARRSIDASVYDDPVMNSQLALMVHHGGH
jgi:hypothetical protein